MKVVTCMRTDLNMRKGKMAGQAQHGIQYMILDNVCQDPTNPSNGAKRASSEFMEWVQGDHTKIVVGVDSLAKINSLSRKAIEAGVPAYVVQDLGKTDIPALTVTCLVLGPAEDDVLDKITGGLSLL